MSFRLVKIIAVLLIIGIFGGCGQKGDLYLPGEKQTALVSVHYLV